MAEQLALIDLPPVPPEWDELEVFYSLPQYAGPLVTYLRKIATARYGHCSPKIRTACRLALSHEHVFVEPCVGGGALVTGMQVYAPRNPALVLTGDARDYGRTTPTASTSGAASSSVRTVRRPATATRLPTSGTSGGPINRVCSAGATNCCHGRKHHMPRFAKARDAAEPATITALKSDGWSVSRLEPVGNDHGLPDLVLGKAGWTTLAEVKNPAGPKGGRKGKKLTDHQQTWHDAWLGATPLMLDRATSGANVDVANAWLMRAQGICPCSSATIDDPGPHLSACPWSDPKYPGDGSDIPW